MENNQIIEDTNNEIIETKEIDINVSIEKNFSYAHYHTDSRLKVETYTKNTSYSFIHSISITNNTDNEYNDLKLNFTFSHSAFHTFDIHINSLNRNETKDISNPFLIVDKVMLDNIIEPEAGCLKVSLSDSERMISEIEIPFNILPISQLAFEDDEYVDERLYAKFVTPLASKVKQITIDAEALLKRSLVGYQNTDKNKLLEEVEAIYTALHNYGIIYQNPPAKRYGVQRIRMPEEVLTDRKGTCIDLAILFSACLEEIGLNPIIQFGEGHALAGLFLNDIEEENNEIPTVLFENGIEKREEIIRNLVGNKIIIIDAVCLVSNQATSFQQAIDNGKEYVMRNYGKYFKAIDIKTCHLSAFSPIPCKGAGDEIIERIDPLTLVERQTEEISNEKYINVLKPEEKTRFTFWERKLLDLSEINPLVNINTNNIHIIRIISENPIYEAIFKNDVLELSTDFLVKVKKTKDDNISKGAFEYVAANPGTKPSFFNPVISNKDLLYGVGFEATLEQMIKKSNASMDETGAQTLFICFGLLTYRRKNGKNGQAPFIILPVEKLVKSKVGNKYFISIDVSDFMINQTFFEYYKNEHPGSDFSELYSCSAADGYMNIVNSFKANSDIRLDEKSVFISNLSFSHYIMWSDIRKRQDALKENKIIESIIENKNLLDEKMDYENTAIDDIEKYADFAAPLPYDSTQLRAILESGNGKSFILDGPPGTGKSQTIVNMIVNAFYHGKSVLFVAEKKAALDVVYDRLEKIKLSRFALELHSNKANKDNFYNKLSESMEFGPTLAPFEFNVNCIDLEAKRDYLRDIIIKMHGRNEYFYSLYDSIVAYERLKLNEYEYFVKLDELFLKSLDKDKFKEINNLIDKYVALSKSISNYENNPFRFLDIINIRFSDKNQIIDEIKHVKSLFDEFIKSYDELANSIEIDLEKTPNNIDLFINNLDIVINNELYIDNIYEFNDNDRNDSHIKIFDLGLELNNFIESNKNKYKFEGFKNINPDSLLNELDNTTGFFKKLSLNGRIKKIISNVLNDKYNKKEMRKYLSDIKYYNDNYDEIALANDSISKLIGIDYISNLDKTENIKKKYINSIIFLNNLKKIDSHLSIDFLLDKLKNQINNDKIKFMFNNLKPKYYNFKEEEKIILAEKYLLNYNMMELSNPFDRYVEFLNYATDINNFSEMLNIASINSIIKCLNDNNMSLFIVDLKNNKFNIDDFKDFFEWSIVNGLLELYFKNDDINYFNAESFQYEIYKYREYIKKYSSSVIEEVSARLSSKLDYNSIDYKASSSIGQLKKIFTMKRNKPSIRETLLKYDEVIKSFFPCFLMSPLSAAQYLSVDGDINKFDIVIFDEASQIPTHEAVGPIARGKSLIVAGDPKQMPPSSYFNAEVQISEDDIEFEDSASLLDECLAIDLPRIRLNYHYRSQHESLISFSNQNFYKNDLYTFPSPSTKASEVLFHYVKLNENKKSSVLSPLELEAIWEEVEKIYTDNRTWEKSLGIIVFNVIQKQALEAFIDKKLNSNIEIKERILKAEEKTKEPLFIKSLENVQGDERDIIILSVGFRLNYQGHPNINGPLAANNGERRLNVAASRSKFRMIIVSTIKYTDFESDDALKKNKNNGATYLKKLIYYAENSAYELKDLNKKEDNSIVSFIKNDLEALGYNIDTNVGLSNYKVDIAIKSSDGSSYILGVLIDNSDVSELTSIRDELYLTESFLSDSLKWNLINIYTIEYFKNPKRIIDYIISNIGKDVKKVSNYEIDPNIVKAPVGEFNYKYNTVEYNKVSKLIPLSYSSEYGFNVSNIRKNLQQIIDVEGPVSYNIIKNYINDCTDNLAKIGTKADKYIKCELQFVLANKTVDLDSNGKPVEFYWPKDLNYNLSFFRISDRDINDIPKEELAAAMKQILKLQGRITFDDLFKATLEAFKYGEATLNNKNKSKLQQAYKYGFEAGFLEDLSND